VRVKKMEVVCYRSNDSYKGRFLDVHSRYFYDRSEIIVKLSINNFGLLTWCDKKSYRALHPPKAGKICLVATMWLDTRIYCAYQGEEVPVL
jgi:hypothetical protein